MKKHLGVSPPTILVGSSITGMMYSDEYVEHLKSSLLKLAEELRKECIYGSVGKETTCEFATSKKKCKFCRLVKQARKSAGEK